VHGVVDSLNADPRLVQLHRLCPINDANRSEAAAKNPLVLLATGENDPAVWSRIAGGAFFFIDGLKHAQRLTGATGASAFRDALGRPATQIIESRDAWLELAPTPESWDDEQASGITVVGSDKYSSMAKESFVRPITLLQALRIIAAHEAVIEELISGLSGKKLSYERRVRYKRVYGNLTIVPAVYTISNAAAIIAELRRKAPRVVEYVTVAFQQLHDPDRIYKSYWPAKKHAEYEERQKRLTAEGKPPEVLLLLEGIEKGFGVTYPTALRLSLALKELQTAGVLEAFGGDVEDFSSTMNMEGSYRYEPFKYGQFLKAGIQLPPFSLTQQVRPAA
jgi:hypothetical protein